MRILSKFNRLKVIIIVGILIGMPCYFFTTWWYQKSHDRLQLIHQYVADHHCQLLGYTKRGSQAVYQCEGIMMHNSDIVEAVSLSDR